ncbi:MAG: hypothetical protein KAW45_01170 [Thermoplasmatales archaeon]|nr:hypothetical protein [Thermoplasmatales archaeon]
MKRINGRKLRSLAVVFVMLLSILAIVNLVVLHVDTVGATHVDYGNCTAFNLVAPSNDSVYARGKNVYIDWSASVNVSHYTVNISRYETLIISANASTNTYYNFSTATAGRQIGRYNVSVFAQNETTGNNTFATGNNKSFYVIHGTPGYNAFQGGNERISPYGDEVLSTQHTNFVYDPDTDDAVTITVNNTAGWIGGTTYYLWKPKYNGTAHDAPYELAWKDTSGGRVTKVGGGYASFTGGSSYKLENVVLDRAGLWIINPDPEADDSTNADFSSYTNYNSTVAAWFWVNGSSDYTLTTDTNEFEYNSSGYVTLNVKDAAGSAVNAIVDIRYDVNGTSIYSYNRDTSSGTTGEYTGFYKNRSYTSVLGRFGFWSVGNYTAYAYRDTDSGFLSTTFNQYEEKNMDNCTSAQNGHKRWNATYGAEGNLTGASSIYSAATLYNWTLAGGWDPPEYEAATKSIRVTTATPYVSVANTTQHYGFEGEVNITIRESSSGSKFIEESKITTKVYNPDDTLVSYTVNITNQTHSTQGFININATAWGKDNGDSSHIGGNGTWYAVIYIDQNNDRSADHIAQWTEEWNVTVEWTVTRAGAITFNWEDDDGDVGSVDNWGFKNTRTDGEIPYIPDKTNVPLDVEFYIRGDLGGHFGDITTAGTHQSGKCKTIKQCAENISISGNSLFTGTLDKFPGYIDTWASDNQTGYSGGADGVWHVPIIPTMGIGGGTITISYTAYNSSGSQTLSVGGTEYAKNGTILTCDPNEFDIDVQNQTLTITAKDGDEATIPFSWANLYYLDDNGSPYYLHEVEHAYIGSSGTTTINFNKTMQTTNQTSVDFDDDNSVADSAQRAPRNLTIYVDGPNRRDGYVLIQMGRSSDLEVEIYPTTMLAGYKYGKFYVNCTMAGNSTATPNESATDKDNFYVLIENSAGNDVTTSILRCIDNTNDLHAGTKNAYSFDFSNNVYGIAPDTYTFYCFNNTHDSAGYNATLIIDQVEVTSDTTPLIWNYDDNISVTFTITYNGEPIDGTLRIDNVSNVATPGYNKSWALCNFTTTLATTGSDESGENTSLTISDDKIDNGVVTVHDLTANHLDTGTFVRNISFWFEPVSPNDGSYARAIGRLPVRVPTVTPDPQYIPLEGTTTVTLLTTGRGIALPDIFVGLDGRGISIAGTNGTTGVDGKLALSVNPVSAGNMDIHVGEDGRIVETKVVVTNWKIDIDAPVKVNEGSDFTVTLTELASGDAIEDASVTLGGVGTVTTDADGIASFSGTMIAPQVSSDIAYTLTAAKEGYVGATATITIINVPKLTLTIKYPNTKGEGSTTGICVDQTFTVTVSKDDANPAVNALVALQGDATEHYTDGNGQVTLTAPSTAGAYTITASFGAFQDGIVTVTVLSKDDDWCKTPGFELLTLLVAIGVAFILLRRRRR